MLAIAASLGLQVPAFYRAASDRRIDALIQSVHGARNRRRSMLPRDAAGARSALADLRQGGSLCMLMDQKMNDGIPMPFLGRMAMTAPALALSALRYRLPLVPIRSVRRGPAQFTMVVEAPLLVDATGHWQDDVLALSLAINWRLECWIRQDPGARLWLHRSWSAHPLNISHLGLTFI